MLTDLVMDGDKVELQSMDRHMNSEDEEKKTKVYTTKVYTVLTDDRVEIMMPMEKTKLILLPVDGVYDLCFYTQKGLYQCYARIYDRYKSNNVYVIALELTSNLRKHQRREYFRFSTVIDMRIRELKKEEIDSLQTVKPVIVPGLPLRRGLICDISGGGMRVITDTLFEEDKYVYGSFNININGKIKEFETTGKVLKAQDLVNRPGEYEHRIQFINMSNDDREEIIKYIFEEERRLRRRSMR